MANSEVVPPWYEAEAKAFYQQTLDGVKGLSSQALAAHLEHLDEEQRSFLEGQCINLYPGTNVMSPRVARLLGSRLATRASEGHPGAKYQTGLQWSERAEVLATELTRVVFQARFAEVRALSGSMANMAVLNALTRPGDSIFSLSTSVGGHISHRQVGAAGYRGLDIHTIPYDVDRWEIKLQELRDEVKAIRPRLIILGASLILFEYPIAEVRAIADEVGAWLMYDAAHVAGLVAGGVWQHPLKEGAHVMTASTYKSLGGPPGGIVVTDDEEIAKRVDRAVFPGMTANYHTQRMAPLAIAMLEAREFGRAYAQACAENAKSLAQGMDAEGLPVAGEPRGWTNGHMLALDVHTLGGGRAAAHALEKAHIICNMNLLPWDPLAAVRNPSGLRLAVQEVTRWGMGPREMETVAKWIHAVLVQGEDPGLIRQQVMQLKGRFPEVRYCFP